MTAKEIRAGMIITVLAATVNLLSARQIMIVLQMKFVFLVSVSKKILVKKTHVLTPDIRNAG